MKPRHRDSIGSPELQATSGVSRAQALGALALGAIVAAVRTLQCALRALRKASRVLPPLGIQLTLAAFSVATANAAEAQVFTTPPLTNQPTEVHIAVTLEEITDIDEAANTFGLKGYLQLVWRDPRLAFDPIKMGVVGETYLEKNAQEKLDQIWWPDVKFSNETEPRRISNEELIISSDGSVEYRERFRATMASNYDMRKFSFDTQKLTVKIKSFAWTDRVLVFRVESDVLSLAPQFRIPGWTFVGFNEEIRESRESGEHESFSLFTGSIEMKREPGFFLFKFIVPLTVVMLLITSVFWIAPEFLKDRVGATLTGILTAAAYGFTISRYLPKYVYNTLLDAVVMLSVLFAAGIMVENVTSHFLHNKGHRETAVRLDVVSRWLFPLAYFMAMVGIVWFYAR
jgi:hypothetical protein